MSEESTLTIERHCDGIGLATITLFGDRKSMFCRFEDQDFCESIATFMDENLGITCKIEDVY